MTEEEFRNGGVPTPPAFDYMAEADKTCSIVYNPQFVDRDDFVNVLTSIAGFCEDLNMYKKLLFRGKTPEDLEFPRPLLANSLAVEFDPNNPMPGEVDLLHGIVGAITEAGELAEVLLHRIETNSFDRVNVLEEGGDISWYLVRILRGLGIDMETMHKANIDKLHGRHGEAFDVFRDANRNLATERAKLEEAAAPLFDSTDSTPPVPATHGDCEGSDPHSPPAPGLAWQDGCWRREIARDVPGLAV